LSAVTAVWVRKYEELVKERARLEQLLNVSQQVALLFDSTLQSTVTTLKTQRDILKYKFPSFGDSDYT